MRTPAPNSSGTDVVIIGGGPAGTATAIELARLGFAVTVLERSDYRNVRIGESLAPAVAPRLARLGVWQAFLDQKHVPSYAVRGAWGTDVLHDVPHIFNPYGMGWHVDRPQFDRLLMRRARDVGAKICMNARCTKIDRGGNGDWRIVFVDARGEHVIRARFLVDASGRSSNLRRKLGVDDEVYDQLVGVAVWFEHKALSSQNNSYALIESVEHGWWYSAPVPTGKLIVMFMSDLDLYQTGRRRAARYWYEHLEETYYTRDRVTPLRPVSPPQVYLAHSHQVVGLGSSGWLPVGEAMQGVDPLSGQGVCNALQMAEEAAGAINGYFDGKPGALSDYVAQIDGTFSRYLEMRRYYYAKEIRWTASVFWQRRAAPESTTISNRSNRIIRDMAMIGHGIRHPEPLADVRSR